MAGEGSVERASGEEVPGSESEREGGGPGEVLACVEDAHFDAGFASELLDDLAVVVECLEVWGADADEGEVAHLGVAGDQFVLTIEQGLGGTQVTGGDSA